VGRVSETMASPPAIIKHDLLEIPPPNKVTPPNAIIFTESVPGGRIIARLVVESLHQGKSLPSTEY
jgi:hypothetical protein